MTLPHLARIEKGYFDPVLEIRTLEPFYLNTDGTPKVHVGTQLSAWHGDDALYGGFWSYEEATRPGPAPLLAVPINVRIDGAANDTGGTYPVAPVAAATTFNVLCELRDAGNISGITLVARLYNAITGALVQTVTLANAPPSGTSVFAFAGVATGSYQLCLHISGALQEPISEAQYTALTGLALSPLYRYTEDGIAYFWDYQRNLGRRPADADHVFYARREVLLAAGDTIEKPEWALYSVSGTPDEGEWAFLRIKVGGGAWSAGSVFPNPGPALYRKAAGLATAWTGIPFDTMARSIGKAELVRWGNGDDLSPGDQLITGMLANENGPATALWKLATDGTATLLGWNPDLSNGWCQCAKRNHAGNGIKELRDGTIFVLSECSVMIYDPNGVTVGQRLPGYPLGTSGEPGGYSLRVLDDKINFFTESFVRDATHFYNRFQQFANKDRADGPGTAWHGRECSETLWGSLWGFMQDGRNNTTAQQWLARMSNGGTWDKSHTSSFPANLYQWRQMIACGGKLICAGAVTNSDLPIWGVDDGHGFREYQLAYLPRYMSTCLNADGVPVVLATARKIVDGEPSEAWYVIELTGLPPSVTFTFDGVDPEDITDGDDFCAPISDFIEHDIDVTTLPLYLVWHLHTAGADGCWQATATQPGTGLYLTRVIDEIGGTVCYVVTTNGEPFPYSATIWGAIEWREDYVCFPPVPTCDNPDCIIDGGVPDATILHKVIQIETQGSVWEAIQVGDLNDFDTTDRLRTLEKEATHFPNLFCRVDSSEDQDDLTTYTHRLRFNLFESLPVPAYEKIEVCVLWRDDVDPIFLPAIDRRG